MSYTKKIIFGSIAGVLALILLITTLVLLTSYKYSVPNNMVAVQIGAGGFEAPKIKGCKPPASRGFFTNDRYVYFPTSEREWDATGQKGSDAPPFQSTTDDSVVMNIPVTVRFTLRTDCDTLIKFMNAYAQRYGASFNEDGSYNDEWITLLRKLVGDPADATLDRIIQDYKWRDVWNDPKTKVLITNRLNQELRSPDSLLVQTAKASYFEGISVLIGAPKPANQELSDAVALEQTNVAKAQSAEAQADADAAKANAQVAVAKAEAAKQEAVIAGYGSVDNYLKSRCIELGCNPFQPTYIIGGTK